MAPRGFDHFMLHIETGRNLKLGRLTPAERCAWVLGVLPIAAKARVRGAFMVGNLTAGAEDVVHQAAVPKATALSMLKKVRALGMLEHDADLGAEWVHDFHEHNPEPKFKSDPTAARRQALHRDSGLRDAVRGRDGDACRYCGITVIWTDRRSAKGGTYDHVNPDGPNSFENLVVACRGCNGSKGNRTPEAADMPLSILPGSTSGSTPSSSGVDQESLGSYTEEEVEEEEKNTPQPPQAGEPWNGPPPRPAKNRQTDLAAWDQQMDAYASWLVPDVAVDGRTDLVKSAVSFARPATNERVKAITEQWARERSEAA